MTRLCELDTESGVSTNARRSSRLATGSPADSRPHEHLRAVFYEHAFGGDSFLAGQPGVRL
jgi:hypothetical protein